MDEAIIVFWRKGVF